MSPRRANNATSAHITTSANGAVSCERRRLGDFGLCAPTPGSLRRGPEHRHSQPRSACGLCLHRRPDGTALSTLSAPQPPVGRLPPCARGQRHVGSSSAWDLRRDHTLSETSSEITGSGMWARAPALQAPRLPGACRGCAAGTAALLRREAPRLSGPSFRALLDYSDTRGSLARRGSSEDLEEYIHRDFIEELVGIVKYHTFCPSSPGYLEPYCCPSCALRSIAPAEASALMGFGECCPSPSASSLFGKGGGGSERASERERERWIVNDWLLSAPMAPVASHHPPCGCPPRSVHRPPCRRLRLQWPRFPFVDDPEPGDASPAVCAHLAEVAVPRRCPIQAQPRPDVWTGK